MTLIDAADDYFKNTKTMAQRTHRESYSLLSEFCHPNFRGITMQGEINENGVVKYDFNPRLEKKDLVFFSYLLMSISSFLTLYDNIFDLLEKEEELPKLN